MIGYYSKPVEKKVRPLRQDIHNEMMAKLRKGTIKKDEMPRFLLETSSSGERHEIIDPSQRGHARLELHKDPNMAHVFEALQSNRADIERAIMDGEPVLFDSCPLMYEDLDQEVFPYKREHLGGDITERYYREYKSKWTVVSGLI